MATCRHFRLNPPDDRNANTTDALSNGQIECYLSGEQTWLDIATKELYRNPDVDLDPQWANQWWQGKTSWDDMKKESLSATGLNRESVLFPGNTG